MSKFVHPPFFFYFCFNPLYTFSIFLLSLIAEAARMNLGVQLCSCVQVEPSVYPGPPEAAGALALNLKSVSCQRFTV